MGQEKSRAHQGWFCYENRRGDTALATVRLLFEIQKNFAEGVEEGQMYDVMSVGAGPGGIFSAYELSKRKPDLRIAVFDAGHALEKRCCPIDGVRVKSCIGCKPCSIMNGF